jgi:hypothetical protein
MCSHVLNKEEQMVRYYGYYSVSSRFIFPIQSHLKFPVKEVGLEL